MNRDDTLDTTLSSANTNTAASWIAGQTVGQMQRECG